ncbi:MAG: GNAT family protein [Comamonas sp.]|uniref:GNAT family N-acetyltransferase n=1 Tax=Comamonas sp. TaxID=34028 RepID=UPI002FC5C2AD
MNPPFASPVVLQGHGLRLEPLTMEHEPGLRAAAADGELWNLRVTSVPRPEDTAAYIQQALDMQTRGERLPWAVLDANTGRVLGCTSYHDLIPAVRRVEIGWTWYARSVQRSHVNTAAKLLLMTHAFETLNCTVVGWRTDILNLASQRAIERLGARKDGVLRSHALRRDGSIRDTVMYSLLASEWPEVRARLSARLQAPPLPAGD